MEAYIYDAVRTPRGKGKKERIVPVGRYALEAIRSYIENRSPREREDGTIVARDIAGAIAATLG